MRIRVAVLTSSVSRKAGGLFQSVRRLTQGIVDGGGEAIVLGCSDEFTKDDLLMWGKLEVFAGRVVGPQSFGYSPGWMDRLAEWKPDLLHVHGLWTYASVACVAWSSRSECPSIVSPRGMLDAWALRNSHWKKRAAGLLYEDRHLRMAGCLHALNEDEVAAMRSYGLKGPICVVPNGVDLPLLGEEARADRSISREKICLFLGRLHPKKGLPGLLKRWGMIRPQGWRLAIAGWDQGGHESLLRSLAREAGVSEQIDFVGPAYGERKADLFRQADAFILPSRSEGLPVAVLEAWSHALPVAMTDACNLKVGFEEKAAMRLSSDCDGLEALFQMSLADLRGMGMRGRHLVEQRFTWDRIAMGMAEVYQWMLGRGPRPKSVSTV